MQNTQQNALTLTTIQLSGVVSLPVLMAGYFVGVNYPMQTGILQIILGNFLLCIAACAYAQVAYNHKEITVMIAKRFFGNQGGLICGTGMLLILLGWGIIQLHYMTTALQVLFGFESLSSRLIFSALTCTLFYFVLINGLKSYAKINKILFPMMLVILCCSVLNFSSHGTSFRAATEMPVALGVIIILTASSGMLYDLPTYFRHAETTKDARISLLLLFLLIIPAIQIAGLILANFENMSSFSGFDTARIFATFNKFGLCFLFLSGFLSNCLNIYSSVMIVTHFTPYSYQPTLKLICFLCAGSTFFAVNHSLISMLEGMNLLSEIMLCLLLVYISFNGAKLNEITSHETKRHASLLYLVLIGAIAMAYLPFPIFKDYFINAALLAMLVMTMECCTRRYL